MYNVMLLGSAIDTGGAERVMANLTRFADRSNFRVLPCHLVRPRGAIGDELVRDGFEVLDVGRSEVGIQRYLSFRSLARLVREYRIDLIHSHTHYALNDASLCSLSTGRRVKVVHTFHYGNYPHIPGRYKLLEGFGSRVAHRLVAVGIEQAKRVRSTFGLRENRVGVVTNGVDVVTPAVDADWQARLVGTGAVVIGTICTCIEQKGLPDLLRVAAALKRRGVRAVFVVVGDGLMRLPVEAQCREMGLEGRVFFTGWKRQASATMLPIFDIFFQPSLWEAMSMVVLEAMAAGKPVVATDVGDNRHVLAGGESGFVVPRGDVAGMADRLADLVGSETLRRRMGEAGVRRHAEHYTVDRMTRKYEEIYLDVLGGRAAASEAA